jgi:hypothetical protein
VNRPESERLIIPTEWTEFSLQFYGSITHNLHYAIALTNGPEAKEFKAPTWIRGGKEGRLDLHGPSSVTFNPELNYSGLENWTFSLSGYFGNTGQGGKIMVNNGEKEVKAPLKILSGYARYDWKNLRLVAVGAFGKLGETEDLFQLTKETSGTGQVIGSSVYGYYIEAGWNLLKKKAGAVDSVKRKFFEKSEMALPLFFRVERFDTHAQVASAISQQPFIHNNMFIGVVGINFNPNEHLVFKADYVLRSNLSANEGTDADTDLFELGMGFSF